MIGPIVLKNDKRVNLSIMNLGMGGIHGIVPKNEADDLGAGVIVRLEGITGAVNFHFPRGVEMEIKWIMEADLFDHVGMGCEFLDLPESVGRQISRFIDSERASRGQYT